MVRRRQGQRLLGEVEGGVQIVDSAACYKPVPQQVAGRGQGCSPVPVRAREDRQRPLSCCDAGVDQPGVVQPFGGVATGRRQVDEGHALLVAGRRADSTAAS